MIGDKLSIFEMFSGYGGASFALKKLGIDFECVGYSEIDKFACQCYEQNHEAEAVGDCTEINPWTLDYFDLLTAGFPCQSFSIAGKGMGELDIRGTLFNEIIRIAEVKKPRWMLLENVKGLTTKKHKATFEKILSELDRIGYSVEWKVLNSKDYGIPQNRDRVFFVCFRDSEDWEKWGGFPEKEELEISLNDLLDDDVEDKFNITNEKLKSVLGSTFASRRALFQGDKNVCNYLAARDYKEPKIVFDPRRYKGEDLKRVYKDVIPTLMARARNDESPVINTEKGFRFITPIECFRLMGFLEDEINLDGLSNTQRYKLAGNGWDINLVSKIFNKLYAQYTADEIGSENGE